MQLIEKTVKAIEPQDQAWRNKATERLEQLTMPHWALGRLMDMAQDLAGITQSIKPDFGNKTIVTMAGDHGVTAEGVSSFPSEATVQMVHNFVNGGAGINALAKLNNTNVVVVDMGVAGDLSDLAKSGKIVDKRIADGTENMAKGPAMSREQAIAAIEAGIEIALELGKTTDIFGTGDMGIGNTTPSTAIVSMLTDATVAELTGRGTGIEDDQLKNKVKVIEAALELNAPDASDGIDVLSKVGGFEIGGIAGLILGAASLRKPVVVDGFISTAGALIAQAIAPDCTDYIIAAHNSVEPGHKVMLGKLGKQALLDLNLRLGEGTGAALAMNIVDASVSVLTEVATFEEAHVSEGN
ncbi:MAG: nicotinate-nucleotide--dimethylbenzimidazole phosphoribosyltransferase [Planctomycetes bacterium]|nr:nicotinate-nucleotide--dimethylbenzimidazole phosphoribosyltransferase [Planctomycetota bacterium]